MSDYTKVTNFTAKDALTTGDAEKIILGSDMDAEFDAIVSASATKEDSSNKGASSGYAGLDAGSLVPSEAQGGSGGQLPFATEILGGVAELATTGEAQAMTNDTRIVTPLGIADILGDNGAMLADIQALADPGSDKLLGWDDSAGAVIGFAAGIGLLFSTTNLQLDVNGLSAVTPAVGDAIPIYDASVGAVRKTTITNLNTLLIHDNLAGFVANEHIDHSGVTLTAGEGLTGGGTIASNRAFAIDFAGLSNITSASFAATDVIALYDLSGTEHFKVKLQDIGTRIVAVTGTRNLAIADSNAFLYGDGTARTLTIPDSVFAIGAEIALGAVGAGTLTLVAGTNQTIKSLGSNLVIKAAGGGAYLVQYAADTWQLVGDLV